VIQIKEDGDGQGPLQLVSVAMYPALRKTTDACRIMLFLTKPQRVFWLSAAVVPGQIWVKCTAAEPPCSRHINVESHRKCTLTKLMVVVTVCSYSTSLEDSAALLQKKPCHVSVIQVQFAIACSAVVEETRPHP
jgi:hypothetical protein